MKSKWKLSLLWLCFLIMPYSCIFPDNDLRSNESLPSEESDLGIPHYLDAFGISAIIFTPHNWESEVDIRWNENFGRIEFSAGKSVDFFIAEGTADLDAKRHELESGLFRIQYIHSTPDLIYYESILPDGTVSYFNFFQIIDDGRYGIHIESNPLVEFSREDIEIMLDLLRTVRLVGSNHDQT